MPFVTFFQQLWRICNDSYFLRWELNILLLTLLLSIILLRLVSSFASLFIFSNHAIATGTGRWHSKLWPAVVCR